MNSSALISLEMTGMEQKKAETLHFICDTSS